MENSKAEVGKPFEKEAELNAKLARLAELNAELNMDERGDNAADMEDEPGKGKATIEDMEAGQEKDADTDMEAGELKVSESAHPYHADNQKDKADERPSLLDKMARYKAQLSKADNQMTEQKQEVLQERRSYGKE